MRIEMGRIEIAIQGMSGLFVSVPGLGQVHLSRAEGFIWDRPRKLTPRSRGRV